MIAALALAMGIAHGGVTDYKVGHYLRACDCRPFLARVPGRDMQGRELYLTPGAALAWQALLEHALKSGVQLTPTYAHRDRDQQRRLRKRLGGLAAKPGKSPHELGVAVDIDGTRVGRGRRMRRTELYRWLSEEAPKFGFVNTIRREPWHWEYRPDVKQGSA